MHQLQDTVDHVIRRAIAKGASAADVLIREEDTFSVSLRMAEVETLKQAITRVMLLRVFSGKRTATSSTSDLSENVVDDLVDDTVAMAALTSEDESGGLPDTEFLATSDPDLSLLDEAWEKLSPAARIDLAARAERAAFSTDARISNSDGSYFDYSRTKTVVGNSEGFAGQYEGTSGGLYVSPIAASGAAMQRDYWMSAARHLSSLEMPENIGRKAAERALRRLDARKVSTCEVPVVFDPVTARSLIGHVLQAVGGDAVYRQSSFLAGELGNRVAASEVTILDDAHLPAGLGSRPFDDEGIGTRTATIVENGVLRQYLHTGYSARKLRSRPTGNGYRAGSGGVTIGPHNFFLQAGPYAPEDIVGSVKSGLYVVELIGFGVNTVTGDYSRGAVGLWIENGRLTHSVQEITIAGNLRDILLGIEMIGNDLMFLGSVAAPTLKVRNMVISGG